MEVELRNPIGTDPYIFQNVSGDFPPLWNIYL
jgi:hypothetical protein